MNTEVPPEEISIGEFVCLLMKCKNETASQNISQKELLRYGHFRLWLDDSDETHPEKNLNRQTAARILHNFLRIECDVKDLKDISSATNIKDLYTCRVCANHIAQVVQRGIMQAQEIPSSETLEISEKIFNHLEFVTKKEALEIVEKASKLINKIN